ncbi:glucan biosynthesis protein, partial [Vibrio sp. Vb0877]
GSAGLSVSGLFDLNTARTMAQTSESAASRGATESRPITFEALAQRAERLAAEPYRPPGNDLPQELAALDYDAFQAIRFRP